MARQPSRNDTTRETDERRKPWAPPSRLDAPDPPEGYTHRWIRIAMRGEEDKTNVNMRLREGWELVKAEEYPNYPFPVIDEGRYSGIIGQGGLALARIPVETANERAAYYGTRTREQITAVDQDLMKEEHPSMPLHKERQSRVTFGGKRKADTE